MQQPAPSQPSAPADARISLMGMSVGARLAGASVICAALWLGVFWAIA